MSKIAKCQACNGSLQRGRVERLGRVLCLPCGVNEAFDRYRDDGTITKWILSEALLRATDRNRGARIDRADLVAKLEAAHDVIVGFVDRFGLLVWQRGDLAETARRIAPPATLASELPGCERGALSLRLSVETDRALLTITSGKSHVGLSLPFEIGARATLRTVHATMTWVGDVLAYVTTELAADAVDWTAVPVDGAELSS